MAALSSTLTDTRRVRHPVDGRITASRTFGTVTLRGLPGSPRDLADLLIELYADPEVRELLDRSVAAASALENASGSLGSDGLRSSAAIDAAEAEVEQVSLDLAEALAELDPEMPPVELSANEAIAVRELLHAQRLGQGNAGMSSRGWRSA